MPQEEKEQQKNNTLYTKKLAVFSNKRKIKVALAYIMCTRSILMKNSCWVTPPANMFTDGETDGKTISALNLWSEDNKMPADPTEEQIIDKHNAITVVL